MSPAPQPDGHDLPWLADELVPGMAAHGDDLVVGFEDAVGQPVVTHKLPDILDRIEFRGSGRQGDDGDVRWYDQLIGHMPSGPIHHEHGVRSGRDLGGDLIEMPLHATGVAAGQDQGGTDTACRAHGPKDVGGAGAFILGCYRTCSSPGPASRDLVLLADPGFILPPQLYPGSRR